MRELPYIEQPPLKEQLPNEPLKVELYENVRKALCAVPAHFSSPVVIEGIDAADLFTLNTLLGSAIEVQTTRALNSMRAVWDPDDVWATYEFQRFSESFPDVRLVNPEGHVTLGVELKGWFLLTKEKEPSYRFRATRQACAPWDLIAVFPWSLDNVLSGTPVLHTPFVEQARYAADVRNHYWQHRNGARNTTILCPDEAAPYTGPREKTADKAQDDSGGNFGRLSRTSLTDEWVQRTLDTRLSGIEARHWIRFLSAFREGNSQDNIESELEKIAAALQKEHPARVNEVLEHVRALLDMQ